MSDKRFFVRTRGKVLGPFTAGQLRSLQNRGQISRLDEVSEDRTNWTPAAEVQGLFPATASAPAASATQAAAADGRKPAPAPNGDDWFYVNAAKEQQGPVSRARLGELCAAGVVRSDTPIWRQGMMDWLPLTEALDGTPNHRPRERGRRAEASTGSQAFVAFLKDPVGGLPGLCHALGAGYAFGMGALFCLVYDLCALLGFVLAMSSLFDLPRDFPLDLPRANLPVRVAPAPRLPVAEQAKVLLTFVGLALLPMFSLAASIACIRVITRGHGNFGFDVLSAGAVLLPLGLFSPVAGLLGPANAEVVLFLSLLALCLSLLILNSAFTRVVRLSDQGVILAIPATLVLTVWLCKVAVTSVLFR